MIHKILNWFIGSTWEDRKEKERKAAWLTARRKHWLSKVTKEYWLENTGYEDPPYFLISVLYSQRIQARINKRMEPFYDRIVYNAMLADVRNGTRITITDVVGMTELNGNQYLVESKDTHTDV